MISVCMIVKNAESTLVRCLDQLKPYEVELVIVDTGSTDETRKIASKYTSMLFDYVWDNNFSAARNFAIQKASNDLILVIDSDEYITSFDLPSVMKMAEKHQGQIGRLLRRNEYIRNDQSYCYTERVNRLFSRKFYQYQGRIHEQLVRHDGSVGETYPIDLVIDHSGYEGDVSLRKKKTERNIKLLEQELLENPEDPYYIYQLGKSYYMEEKYLKAAEYFEQALCLDLDEHLEYVIDMVESYGYSLINSGQYKKALGLEGIYQEFSHSTDYVFLMGLIYLNNEEFERALQEFAKATKMTSAKMEGVNGDFAFYNMGVIYECLGKNQKAIECYEKSSSFGKSAERLQSMRNQRNR